MKKDLIWLIIGIICAAFYTGGVVLLGYEWGHSPVKTLQNTLVNERNAAQVVADKAKLDADAKYSKLLGQFQELSANYKQATDEKLPSIANSIPASLAAGNIQLRDTNTCPRSSSAATQVTAASRAADAAATQALADRVQDSINAVRAGDEADKREHDLRAQIFGLQQALIEERQILGSEPNGKH